MYIIITNVTLRFRSSTFVCHSVTDMWGFPDGSVGKESACKAGDTGSLPGSGRFPRGRNGNPFQYSCLENPMDRGARWATVHGVTKSWTSLSMHKHTVSLTSACFLEIFFPTLERKDRQLL